MAPKMADMLSAIPHRGPDGEGTFFHRNVALGHRRLAIIDLSDDAAQPMSNNAGDLVLVFNGEIYNYVELRTELAAKGRHFRSRSDTEVLLQAYEEWGEECVKKLNGMWSFAILDKGRNRLFCSRDRFGEKPFYFTQQESGFYFASEIRQILPMLESRTANRDLLNRFLLGVTGEGVTDCFFSKIEKLPGGHNLVLDLTGNHFAIKRYFDLALDQEVAEASFDQNLEHFGNLFEDSVTIRMRSDVRVGTCLSGGLDSSSIAAVATGIQAGNATPKFSAITARSTESKNDESHFAETVASYLDLNWITTQPSYADFNAAIEDVVLAQEEPFGSASIVMQYYVMKAVAENGIKVLLDGQGGDEVFMGYERYFVSHVRQLFRQGDWGRMFSDILAMNRNSAIMNMPTLAKYMVYFGHVGVRESRVRRRAWYLQDRPSRIAEIRNYGAAMKSPFELQKFELCTANLPPLLRFEDKNAMWHSIETRLPMLDPRLVSFGCSLPVEHKMHDGWSKYMLRRGVEHHLPARIAWRRDKIGFEAPQASWVEEHGHQMRTAIRQSKIINELVDLKQLTASNFAVDIAGLWRLYVAAVWEQKFSVCGLD